MDGLVVRKRTSRPADVEIITRTSDLRERIAAILSPQSGRRVAIVAFIGGDALRFAPEPSGLEVYYLESNRVRIRASL